MLVGGADADLLDGGDGYDRVFYIASPEAVIVNLSDNLPERGGHAEGDVLVSIEMLIGSLFADTLIGDAGNNSFRGLAGADTIDGRGGDADRVLYDASLTAVTVNLFDDLPERGGNAEGDVLRNIEDIYGSPHDDRLTGDSNANYFWGDDGEDVINGRGGIDRVFYTTIEEALSPSTGLV